MSIEGEGGTAVTRHGKDKDAILPFLRDYSVTFPSKLGSFQTPLMHPAQLKRQK